MFQSVAFFGKTNAFLEIKFTFSHKKMPTGLTSHILLQFYRLDLILLWGNATLTNFLHFKRLQCIKCMILLYSVCNG